MALKKKENRNKVKEKEGETCLEKGCEGGDKKKEGREIDRRVVIRVRSASQCHLTRHSCHADSIFPEEIKTTETSELRIILPPRQADIDRGSKLSSKLRGDGVIRECDTCLGLSYRVIIYWPLCWHLLSKLGPGVSERKPSLSDTAWLTYQPALTATVIL